MTVLTLYRIPRRLMRKLLKRPLLALNAHRMKWSENEAYRLLVTRQALANAEAREHRHQVRLMQQRRSIGGW